MTGRRWRPCWRIDQVARQGGSVREQFVQARAALADAVPHAAGDEGVPVLEGGLMLSADSRGTQLCSHQLMSVTVWVMN